MEALNRAALALAGGRAWSSARGACHSTTSRSRGSRPEMRSGRRPQLLTVSPPDCAPRLPLRAGAAARSHRPAFRSRSCRSRHHCPSRTARGEAHRLLEDAVNRQGRTHPAGRACHSPGNDGFSPSSVSTSPVRSWLSRAKNGASPHVAKPQARVGAYAAVATCSEGRAYVPCLVNAGQSGRTGTGNSGVARSSRPDDGAWWFRPWAVALHRAFGAGRWTDGPPSATIYPARSDGRAREGLFRGEWNSGRLLAWKKAQFSEHSLAS